MKSAQGRFTVKMQPEPPFDEEAGVILARAQVAKEFAGPLSGNSQVHMLSARTEVTGSAGYVALEKFSGTLEGKRGGFVCVHLGISDRSQLSLDVKIVPDSGTGQLSNIAGSMRIDILDGVHNYTLDYTLDDG